MERGKRKREVGLLEKKCSEEEDWVVGKIKLGNQGFENAAREINDADPQRRGGRNSFTTVQPTNKKEKLQKVI